MEGAVNQFISNTRLEAASRCSTMDAAFSSILPRLCARAWQPIGCMDETQSRADRYRNSVLRSYISNGRTILPF